VVDTTAPTVSLTAPEDGTLVRGEITLSANVSDANGVRNVLFLIDGEVFDSDMSDPYEPTWDSSTLPDGEHTITVRAYDEAGNTAPDTIVRRSSDDLTSGRTASFEFSSPDDGNATFECSLDGEAFVPCESRRQYQDLPDGEHVFRVRAVDAAGNRDPSPAERRFVIDAGAPGAPVILSPAQSSTDNDGNFSISGSAEPGSTVGLYDGEELVGRAAVD
jgi:hypothetical protein